MRRGYLPPLNLSLLLWLNGGSCRYIGYYEDWPFALPALILVLFLI